MIDRSKCEPWCGFAWRNIYADKHVYSTYNIDKAICFGNQRYCTEECKTAQVPPLITSLCKDWCSFNIEDIFKDKALQKDYANSDDFPRGSIRYCSTECANLGRVRNKRDITSSTPTEVGDLMRAITACGMNLDARDIDLLDDRVLEHEASCTTCFNMSLKRPMTGNPYLKEPENVTVIFAGLIKR